MDQPLEKLSHSKPEDGLDGQWSEILHAGNVDGETYTPDDLDGMVNEYQARNDATKAPVALGIPSQGSSEPVGKIDALRRVGGSLQGKFAGIDPRVEHLYSRGIFSKKSIQVKRSPEGVSLQRVGLIHPKFSGGSWKDGETPPLDDLMKEKTGNKDHIFGDASRIVAFETSLGKEQREGLLPSADAVIASMKKRGYWSRRLERLGFPALFAELDHQPILGKLAGAMVMVMDEGDPTGTFLSERARYFAETRGLSFGDALEQIWRAASKTGDPVTDAARDLQAAKKITFGEALEKIMYPRQPSGDPVTEAARELQAEEKITFGEALKQLQVERPELFSSLISG
jgi:hypothetical protein